MAIIYERRMTIDYPIELTDVEFAKLAKKLHDKGISIVSNYHYGDKGKDSDYGYAMRKDLKTRYTLWVNNKDFCTFKWKTDASMVHKAFIDVFPDYEVELLNTSITTESKQWRKPQGRQTRFTFKSMVGKQTGRHLDYGNNVLMRTTIEKPYTGIMRLTFIIEWTPKKVQKKADIETMMVDIPLHDMGRIQHIIESRLKLKQFGLQDEPSIDCHFDAKTESRSECAPDIVAKVRKARNG